MTPQDFWARLRACGVTPARKVGPSSWVCQTRERQWISVTDPAGLSVERREAYIQYLKELHGLENCH